MRRPSLRSDRAFFLLPAIPLPLIHSYHFAANVLPYSGRRTLVATVYVFRYVVRAAFLPAHNTLLKRPRSKSTLVSLFPGFNCIFVFMTDGNFSSSGSLCFFVFACAKVIKHSTKCKVKPTVYGKISTPTGSIWPKNLALVSCQPFKMHIKNRKQTATLTEANKKKLNTMETIKNLNTSSASRYDI